MNEDLIENKRDCSIDVIKGLCIVLMMIGHVLETSSISRHVIYSFHMPVFFIVGGLFLKRRNLKKDFKRLILPYIIFGSIGAIAINGDQFTPPLWNLISINSCLLDTIGRYLWGIFAAIFWGSCGHHHGAPLFNDIPIIGALWFLPAFFIGKNIYIAIIKLIKNKICLGFTCLALSITAMVVDNYVIYLPFSINQGISTLVFFFIGNNINIRNISFKSGLALVLIWFVSLFLTEVNIAFSRLDLFYLIGVVGVLGASFLIWKIADYFTHIKELNGIIAIASYIGRNSLYIFCFHYILIMWAYEIIKSHGSDILAKALVVVLPALIYFIYDILKNYLFNRKNIYNA